MRKIALLLIAGCILFCAGCKNESYDEGAAFAEEIYGNMDFSANGIDTVLNFCSLKRHFEIPLCLAGKFHLPDFHFSIFVH